MITNESSNQLGPGPAAYDHLRSLKNVIVTKRHVGPVMRQPTDLDDKVKSNLNVSCSQDLAKMYNVSPGPGSYDHDESKFNSPRQKRGLLSGVTIPKYEGARCPHLEGETNSPGPAQYSASIAAQKMQNESWHKKKKSMSNFDRQKRSINLDQRS